MTFRACGWAVALLAAAGGSAAEPVVPVTGRALTKVYQQRLPDGRVVLTDRPVPGGGAPERRWDFEPEDPARAAEAAAKREAASREAAEVNERIQRSIEHRERLQRDLELERLRRERALVELQAERERAARAREEVLTPPVLVVPGWHRPQLPPSVIGPRPWEPPGVPPPVAPPRERPAPLLGEPPPR
ncbi:hypothetical protein [Caldimonas aquatica]|uniref:Translation initiation factor IF-2 n=1 Tax=Caldimonas aquatica TaxID=376175 RepID=A0ABY6MRX2_9BURK|nr:hypothetical protein [Schlegelella aquatica]UZD54761.1 hypothetical protein OMP39_14030 [Schlegelella aquatica]